MLLSKRPKLSTNNGTQIEHIMILFGAEFAATLIGRLIDRADRGRPIGTQEEMTSAATACLVLGVFALIAIVALAVSVPH